MGVNPNNSEAENKDIEQNKAIELFKFKLDIKKIFLDKFILVIIIGGAAFLANKSMETYKNDLAVDRFNQEKKLEATVEIKQIYSELSNNTLEMMYGREEPDPEYIKSAFNAALKMSRKWSFYYTPKEMDDISACLWNYLAISLIPPQEWNEYTCYFNTVNSNFRLICRSAIGLKHDENYFEFIGIPKKDGTINVTEFLRQNYDLWKTSIGKNII